MKWPSIWETVYQPDSESDVASPMAASVGHLTMFPFFAAMGTLKRGPTTAINPFMAHLAIIFFRTYANQIELVSFNLQSTNGSGRKRVWSCVRLHFFQISSLIMAMATR